MFDIVVGVGIILEEVVGGPVDCQKNVLGTTKDFLTSETRCQNTAKVSS